MTPRIRSTLILSAILTANACGDGALTSPSSVRGGSAVLAAAGSPRIVDAVRLLKRSKALKKAESVEGIIGPNGGTLSIPNAGVVVTFSKGAVKTKTRISLTASAGSDVSYEFQPHGIRFGAPVIVMQNLQHTTAESDDLLAESLQGSYFEGSLTGNLIGTKGLYARVAESRKGKLNRTERRLQFSIEHFSGYAISTGLVKVDVDVDVR
jgi:hypothetical protein